MIGPTSRTSSSDRDTDEEPAVAVLDQRVLLDRCKGVDLELLEEDRDQHDDRPGDRDPEAHRRHVNDWLFLLGLGEVLVRRRPLPPCGFALSLGWNDARY